MNNNQDFTQPKRPVYTETAQSSNKPAAAPQIPALISKKFLYAHYQISPVSTDFFYKTVLTPDVLIQLGLTIESVRCKSFRTFTATQSLLLKTILFG